MTLKLGRKPGVVRDRRTLRFKTYIDRKALTARPKSAHTTLKISAWGMLGNDRYGDCGPAACYHADMAMDRRLGRESAEPPSLSQVLDLYRAANPGFHSDEPSTDTGVYTLDLLNAWRGHGLRDPEMEHLQAYVAIDPRDHAAAEFACANFGGLIVGLLLPNRASEQVGNDEFWDLVDQPDGEDEPGSWGGHLVYANGYDGKTFDLVTWGQVQKATYRWLDIYCDELYAPLSSDWLTSSGKTPRGFDFARLLADLKNI